MPKQDRLNPPMQTTRSDGYWVTHPVRTPADSESAPAPSTSVAREPSTAPIPKRAKLFTNGGSQAVRLPAEFRFDVDEVFVRRDERTGDVILSAQARAGWADFMALRAEVGPVPDDFIADRQQGSEERDPLQGWNE